MLRIQFLASLLPHGLKNRSIKEILNWRLTRISWLRWTQIFFRHSMVPPKLAVSVNIFCYIYQLFSNFYLMLSYEGNRSKPLQRRYKEKTHQSWNCLRKSFRATRLIRNVAITCLNQLASGLACWNDSKSWKPPKCRSLCLEALKWRSFGCQWSKRDRFYWRSSVAKWSLSLWQLSIEI